MLDFDGIPRYGYVRLDERSNAWHKCASKYVAVWWYDFTFNRHKSVLLIAEYASCLLLIVSIWRCVSVIYFDCIPRYGYVRLDEPNDAWHK